MEKNEEEFKHIMVGSIKQKLPKGLHYYKFIVDGEWKYNPDEPSAPDNTGNINNYVDNSAAENVFDQKLPPDVPDPEHKNQDDPHNIAVSLGMVESPPVKKKGLPSTLSKNSALYGLQLDMEAPPLPPCFDNALFLNKKTRKQNKLLANAGQSDSFASIMKMLDNQLVQPTHAEV